MTSRSRACFPHTFCATKSASGGGAYLKGGGAEGLLFVGLLDGRNLFKVG